MIKPILLLLIWPVAAGFGQELVQDPLIVSVSSTPIPVGESSTAVTIVSREEIENSHADSLGDLLSTIPHVHVSRPGNGGSLTTATIRGGDPNFTLVLVDGIPANDPTNILGGSYDLSALALDNVERVEVVRGPMSSIYGSAASAGVINVITRRSREGPELVIEGMFGNPWQTGRLRASGGDRIGDTTFSASASFLDREGLPEGVESSLGVVSFGAANEFSADRSLEGLFRYQRAESTAYPENGGGPEFSILDTLKESESGETFGRIGYVDRLTPDWELGLSWDLYDIRRTADTPAILDGEPPSFASLPSILSDTGFTRNRVRVSNTWNLGSNWTTHFGLNVEEERGTTASTIAGTIPADFQLSRTTLAPSGEVRYRSDLLNVDASVRVDKLDGFGARWSPGVGIVIPIPGIPAKVRASWARAFKAPSFYALGDPLVGNPALEPERTRGFDAGIEDLEFGVGIPVSVSLIYFRNTFEDLIDFSPALFQLVNRSEATTQGVEAGVGVDLSSRVGVRGHATYLDWSLGGGVTEPLRDRPRWRGGFGLSVEPFPDANLRWDTLWVSSRYDFQVPVPSRQRAEGYSTTDIALEVERELLDVFVRIENLFDREYHEFIGFPDPGFTVRVGASLDVLSRSP
jgi:iron complex outermembrane receptor protein/vitamin B12 transporter